MQHYCNLLKLGFIFLYNKGNSANLLEFPEEGKIGKKPHWAKGFLWLPFMLAVVET